jgi:hypothetical protein
MINTAGERNEIFLSKFRLLAFLLWGHLLNIAMWAEGQIYDRQGICESKRNSRVFNSKVGGLIIWNLEDLALPIFKTTPKTLTNSMRRRLNWKGTIVERSRDLSNLAH